MRANYNRKNMQDYQSPATLASYVKMLRKAKPEFAVLVVEGESDEAFFGNVVDKKKCKVKSFNGKSKVIAAIEIANRAGQKGILGIVDRDYDDEGDLINSYGNMFITDSLDIESHMFNTDAFQKIINYYGDEDKIEEFESQHDCALLDWIKTTLRPISITRLVNHNKNYGFNFKEMNLEQYVNEDLSLDFLNYIRQIVYYSPQKGHLDNIKNEIETEGKSHIEEDISRGHDLTEYTALILSNQKSSSLGKKSAQRLDGTKLGKDMTLAYRYDIEFIKTKLYVNITEWESCHPEWKVLKVAF